MRKALDSVSFFLLALLSAALLLPTELAGAQSSAQQRQALKTQVTVPGMRPIGPLPGSQRLQLAISLPLRNQAQLNALLQQIYDPASPNYRHFLTTQEFTDEFGPTVVDYQRVIGFAQSYGLKVTHTFANRLVVDVSGTVADIERAFQVRMYVYRHPTENRTFYAPDVEPTVEAGLPVLAVDGLSTFSLPHPMLRKPAPGQGGHSNTSGSTCTSYPTGSGPGCLFLGSDMRAAYAGSTSLNGAGQVLGLIEVDNGYRLGDVFAYFDNVGQTLNVPITNVLLGGIDGVCDATEGGTPCDDGEQAIDIEQIISMAPNAAALIVYEAYGSSSSAVNAYAQAAADNLAKSMSISFGWSGTPSSSEGYEQIFKELAAQGQSSFVASGDAGANSGGGGYPGNSPNITDVGGTDLTTASPGGAWQSETGWSGSGGGWNTASPIPTGSPDFLWDQASAINTSNNGDPSYRNIPDVSAQADTVNYFCGGKVPGGCGGVGGTSLAAPRWAGFVALINQQAGANATSSGSNAPIGFLNPVIYQIGLGQNSSVSYASVFHDITSGSNPSDSNPVLTCTPPNYGCLSDGVQGFNAVTGLDFVTGWGTPNGPSAFTALFPNTTNPNFSMAATNSPMPLTPGNGGTSTISVAPSNGFTGTVNLAVVIPGSNTSSSFCDGYCLGGAPAGLSASLSASSVSGGSGSVTLNVSTTNSTPGGTYIVAVVGTSGNLTQAAYVTVELPAFAGLSASPAGLVVNQSGGATATIDATVINGFNGTIALSASSPPTGVSVELGSFSSVNSTTMASTAIVSATTAATLTGANQPATVLVTGTASGSSSQNVGVNVFVNPPLSGGSGTAVNLSSYYNAYAFYDDANESSITATNSLDGVGFAYSANLLGSGLDFNGTQFNFGPANQPDGVYGTGTPLALPAGSYTTLQMLATGIEGNQASQTVTVTYTDSTTSTFTQSFSDWCSALNGNGCVSTGSNAGESVAVAMPYRDSASGPDNRVFYLYHYSFALNTNKTVQSLTLPNNRDVAVLAVTLAGPVTGPASYSLSAGAPSQGTISPGGTSTATVTVTPANGYTGTVTLSCSVTSTVTFTPAQATCSFNGTSPVTVSGSSGGTATLTFTTVGSSGALLRRSGTFYALLLASPGLALIGGGFGSQGSCKKRLTGFLLLWIVLASLITVPACGGGGNGGGGGGGNTGTPAGTYTITITGTDANGVAQTGNPATVTVAVN